MSQERAFVVSLWIFVPFVFQDKPPKGPRFDDS